MSGKDPQKVIDDFHRRQQTMPFVVGGLAVLLVVIGIIILVVWFAGNNRPSIALFASPTPTNTATFTPTATVPSPTPTLTSTVEPTATITVTSTPSGPFEYVVQEKDTCWDIAIKYKVDLEVLLAINNFAPNTCPIRYQQKILIPLADQKLPTETPYPIENLPKGTKIKIIVHLGETLGQIAERYNTTSEAIMAIKDNNLTDAAKLIAGQTLTIPVNLNTPVPTKAVTATTTITPTKAP
jgi:LysM repeat protein